MPQEETRLDRDTLEAARLWQEWASARVRVQGAGRRDERADGPEAQQMCGEATSAATAGEQPQRLPPQVAQDRRGRRGARDTQAQARHLLPRHRAMVRVTPRWPHRAGDVRVRRVHPQGRARGVKLGISSLRARRSRALLRPRRRGGGVPPPRPVGHACCYLWLDATYMSCRVGSSVVSQGVVTAIGLAPTGASTSWAATWSTPERGLLGGIPRRAAERGLGRCSWFRQHAGLVAAVSRLFQGCAWQRCVTHLQRNLQSACSGRPEDSRRPSGTSCTPRSTRTTRPRALRVGRGGAWVASVSARGGFEQAEDRAGVHGLPRAHWAKLRTNNVQERANREIKRRYRVVQSFPSRESMLRLTCASLMETEGQWSQQRVFSGPRPPGLRRARGQAGPDRGEARALGRRAREIVDR